MTIIKIALNDVRVKRNDPFQVSNGGAVLSRGKRDPVGRTYACSCVSGFHSSIANSTITVPEDSIVHWDDGEVDSR